MHIDCKHLNPDGTCKKVNNKQKHLNRCLLNMGVAHRCFHQEPKKKKEKFNAKSEDKKL